MLMPIVSMNKMAMNESVATTCCFREVATPTAMYWEVLNGGWIGSGYGEVTVKKAGYENLDSTWLNYNYDLVFGATSGGVPGTTLQKYRVRYETLDVNGTATANWYVYDTTGMLFGGSSANSSLSSFAAFFGVPIRTGSTCDHKTNTDCVYRENRAGFLNDKNYHFESKTKHTTGGDNWEKPHEAKKFSS